MAISSTLAMRCVLLFALALLGQRQHHSAVDAAAQINSFGGYENLIVSIGPDVPAAACQQLIGNIQKIFTSASTYLNTATHGKAYFHQVIIVIPAHWDRYSSCGDAIGSASTSAVTYTSAASAEASDFHVTGTRHPIFGHYPYTQQSQGCGKPGDFISIGHHYLLQYNESSSASPVLNHHFYYPHGRRGEHHGEGDGDEVLNNAAASEDDWKTIGFTPAVDRAIIHEWAKFRYGVFEEKGYPNDPIYPVAYNLESGGEKLPSACTNKALKGTWSKACTDPTDTSDGSECVFIPSTSDSGNEGISSSIMSYPDLSSVRYFCDSGNHVRDAPTKQNFLCKQQSIEDVIFSHPDFYNSTARFGGGGSGFGTPEFVIKQLTHPRYVLLIEETGNMNLRDVWKYLKLAVRKFIKYDLSSATQIGLMTIGADVRIIANMTSLDENLRATLAEKLPTYPNIETSSSLNGHNGGIGGSSSSSSGGSGFSLRRGITQAINMLKQNGQRVPGSVIILISQGTISSIDFEASLHLLRQEEVSMATIEYPSAGDGKISYLSHGTNGPHFTIRETGVGPMSHMSTYIQLVNAMMGIQRYYSKGVGLKWPILVHQEEFKGDAPSYVESSFSFDSSQSPGEFYIYVPNPIDPKINQVELISPSGSKFTDKVSKLHDINIIKIDATIDQPGIWRYRIQRLGDSHQSHFVQIVTFGTSNLGLTASNGGGGVYGSAGSGIAQAQAVAHQQQELVVKLFSNVEATRVVNFDTTPLILYADVKRGNSPVLGADVVATINGKWVVKLLDNGNGDPDITKGDGIYSKYIIPPSSSHMTTLDITVKVTTSPYHSRYYSSSDSALLLSRNGNKQGAGDPTCCGSSLTQHNSESTYRTMPYNERLIYSYSVKIFNAREPGSYPPARIGDLRLMASWDTSASFEFTSPGDDYDHGTVDQYHIFWSGNNGRRNVKTFSLKETLHNASVSTAGSSVNFTITFPAHRVYFITVAAIDRSGRQNEFSNIAQVHLVPPPQNYGSHSFNSVGGHGNVNQLQIGASASNGAAGRSRYASSSIFGGYGGNDAATAWGVSSKLSSSEILFIVTGIVLFFLLITLLVLICVYCRRKGAKGLGSTDSHISTISKDCTKVCLPLPNSPSNGGSESGGKGQMQKQPVHWSASELLHSHEKRASMSMYGGQTPQSPNGHYTSYYEKTIQQQLQSQNLRDLHAQQQHQLLLLAEEDTAAISPCGGDGGSSSHSTRSSHSTSEATTSILKTSLEDSMSVAGRTGHGVNGRAPPIPPPPSSKYASNANIIEYDSCPETGTDSSNFKAVIDSYSILPPSAPHPQSLRQNPPPPQYEYYYNDHVNNFNITGKGKYPPAPVQLRQSNGYISSNSTLANNNCNVIKNSPQQSQHRYHAASTASASSLTSINSKQQRNITMV